MFEDLTKTLDLFKQAKNVALFTTNILTIDKVVSIIALNKLCLKEGKEFQLICPGNISYIANKFLSKYSLEVNKQSHSKDYVVSIDYGETNIEKVICKRDEETNKLNFVITPGDELFSFDNVNLISGGSNFDVIFSLGLENVDTLDDITKEMLQENRVVSITKKECSFGDYKFLINSLRSYSEVIYEISKGFSGSLSAEVLTMLLAGVIDKYKLFEKDNNEGWIIASDLMKYGAEINDAIKDIFYSKDKGNLELQKRVMSNVHYDLDSRLAWSKASLLNSNIDKDKVDIRGRIVFNISDAFDIAFVIYQLDNESFKVVIESNNIKKFSAIKLAEVFSGSGSASRAVCNSSGFPGKDFEKRFLETFKEIYGVEVKDYSFVVV